MERLKHKVKAKSAITIMMVAKCSVIPLVRTRRTRDRSEAKSQDCLLYTSVISLCQTLALFPKMIPEAKGSRTPQYTFLSYFLLRASMLYNYREKDRKRHFKILFLLCQISSLCWRAAASRHVMLSPGFTEILSG